MLNLGDKAHRSMPYTLSQWLELIGLALKTFPSATESVKSTVNETRQGKETTPEGSNFFHGKNELPQAGLESGIYCIVYRCSTN